MTRILGLKIGTDAPAGYSQTRVTFDDVDDWISYTDNSNIADSTGLTISFWADIAGVDTVRQVIFDHIARVEVTRNTANKIAWSIKNTSNVVIWVASSDATYPASSGLTHFAIAFDASGAVGQFYVNGVSAAFTNTTAPTAGTIDWARNTASAIGASTTGTDRYGGTLGDFWVNNAYLDLSTNISNFIDGSGNPVDLTGFSSPKIWLGGTMTAADWNAGTNLGSYTATLTMNGAVT